VAHRSLINGWRVRNEEEYILFDLSFYFFSSPSFVLFKSSILQPLPLLTPSPLHIHTFHPFTSLHFTSLPFLIIF
jgi:hypothetical protein